MIEKKNHTRDKSNTTKKKRKRRSYPINLRSKFHWIVHKIFKSRITFTQKTSKLFPKNQQKCF